MDSMGLLPIPLLPPDMMMFLPAQSTSGSGSVGTNVFLLPLRVCALIHSFVGNVKDKGAVYGIVLMFLYSVAILVIGSRYFFWLFQLTRSRSRIGGR